MKDFAPMTRRQRENKELRDAQVDYGFILAAGMLIGFSVAVLGMSV